MSDSAEDRSDQRFRATALAAAVIGAVVRLVVYSRGYSLWQDEVLLSLNIGRRGLASLLQPLTHDQAAPVLYLWLTRLATLAGGVNEYTLRLPALVAGILLPFVIWHVGRRIAGAPAATVATIFAALSPTLIEFSNQVKPYSSDALVAILLAGTAWRVHEQPRSARAWILLVVGGGVGMLLSYPAVFTLVACAVFLALSPGLLRRSDRRLTAASAVALAATGALIYLRFMRPASASPYLQAFWEHTYLRPLSVNLGVRVYSAVYDVMRPLSLPEPLMRPRLLVPVFLAGAAALYRVRGRAAAGLCITTLVVAGAASMAGRYPIALRLLLFLAPFTLLVMASAVAYALSRAERRYAGITAVAGLLLVTFVLNRRMGHLVDVRSMSGGRDAIATVASARGRDPVYVAASAVPIWAFYTSDWTHSDPSYLDRIAQVASSGGVSFSSGPSRNASVDPAEARDLVIDRDTGRELIGLRSGMPYVEGVPHADVRPDSGWVRTEVARMMATSSSHIWIVSTLRVKLEAEPLVRELLAKGAHLEYRFDEIDAAAFRIRLPEH